MSSEVERLQRLYGKSILLEEAIRAKKKKSRQEPKKNRRKPRDTQEALEKVIEQMLRDKNRSIGVSDRAIIC